MKKFTLLIALLFLVNSGLSAQCIRTSENPGVVSNNSGFVQTLNACIFTTVEFISVGNLIVGNDYVLTCTLDNANKYITATDENNVVITHGFSPLTLSSTANLVVGLLYSDDTSYAGSVGCHVAAIQATLQCPLTAGLIISELETNAANFSWQPAGEEGAWNILLSTLMGAGNIRFNPIFFLDKFSQGHFGSDLEMNVPQKDTLILVNGHSLMLEGSFVGSFKVQAKIA